MELNQLPVVAASTVSGDTPAATGDVDEQADQSQHDADPQQQAEAGHEPQDDQGYSKDDHVDSLSEVLPRGDVPDSLSVHTWRQGDREPGAVMDSPAYVLFRVIPSSSIFKPEEIVARIIAMRDEWLSARREADALARECRSLTHEVVSALTGYDGHAMEMRAGLPFCLCGESLDGGDAQGKFITHALAQLKPPVQSLYEREQETLRGRHELARAAYYSALEAIWEAKADGRSIDTPITVRRP